MRQSSFRMMFFAFMTSSAAILHSADSMAMDMGSMPMPPESAGGQAAMSERGRKIAESVCAPCHGSQGVSVSDDFPNLAGQMHMYLSQSLRDYRDKTRASAAMNGVAAKLSDQDIEDLAHYFAHLKPAGQAR